MTYTFDKQKIIKLLDSEGNMQKNLYDNAAKTRNFYLGKKVYFRGLIEFSNYCENDCFYCGIRKSNSSIKRYTMDADEIISAAGWCDKAKLGSIMLQSGETKNKESIDFIENMIIKIKKKFPLLNIALSLGEFNKKTYEKFFDAGAERYLLRMETTCKKHYSMLHPKTMDFEKRKKCLENLKDIGFQTGTGVMIGLPFQTSENLADDLLFFKEIDIDMVGMGPFIPAKHTPFEKKQVDKKTFNKSLNMISVLRLMMPDINIASTTALQTLNPMGREFGLNAGANIIMPIATPKKYRGYYMLYNNKPCLNETPDDCMKCIKARIISSGLTPIFGEHGSPLHFIKREKNGC